MIFKNYSQFKKSGITPTVCIIGSGPAGVSLALQLEKKKISSLIIEAGSLEYSAKSQDFYKGKIIGDFYPSGLDGSRLRYFGGTSGHWGGWCRPLDDVDFEIRNKFKNSGWPIQKKDLDPYAKETQSILEIESFPENIPINDDIQEVFFRFSSVRFGQKYQEHIKKSSLITMLINSPVKSLVPTNQKISQIEIQSEKNKTEKIKAKYFCLCTGGIENSRILLWSNKLHNNGTVPHSEALGKYWMEHPHYNIGTALLYRPSNLTGDSPDSWIRYIAPTSKFLHENASANFACRIPRPTWNLKESLLKDGVCTAVNLFSKLTRRQYNVEMCSEDIKTAWGQQPLISNRVELSDEKDALGIPRVNLYWKKQDISRRTAEAAAKLFGLYLIDQDAGRFKLKSWLTEGLDYPKEDEHVGYHHMGGTRMASTPEKGVVDSNCKVFGMSNLFIGGSSVFATAGHANPTYTIVQLALRLGDHISKLESTVSS